MALEKTIISPSEASGIVNYAYTETNTLLPLSSVFPMKSLNGEKTVIWSPTLPGVESGLVEYRAWDAEAGYGSTIAQSQERSAPLIPMAKKMHVSERDIIGHLGDKTFLRNRMAELFTQLGQEAAVTTELARLHVLVDAKLEINSNNIKGTWNFERPAALNNVTPAKKWGTATSDPQQDIEAWVKLIRAENGRTPSAALTTSGVIAALRTNKRVIQDLTKLPDAQAPTRIGDDDVMTWFRTYTPLKTVRVIDDMYTQFERDNGLLLPLNLSTVVPDGTFIMFSSFNDQTLGFTASGPTAEADDPEYEIGRSVNEGMIGVVMSEAAPVRYDLWVNGTVMPILQQAVSTFKANVL